jgi:hypothetical protein
VEGVLVFFLVLKYLIQSEVARVQAALCWGGCQVAWEKGNNAFWSMKIGWHPESTWCAPGLVSGPGLCPTPSGDVSWPHSTFCCGNMILPKSRHTLYLYIYFLRDVYFEGSNRVRRVLKTSILNTDWAAPGVYLVCSRPCVMTMALSHTKQ